MFRQMNGEFSKKSVSCLPSIKKLNETVRLASVHQWLLTIEEIVWVNVELCKL